MNASSIDRQQQDKIELDKSIELLNYLKNLFTGNRIDLEKKYKYINDFRTNIEDTLDNILDDLIYLLYINNIITGEKSQIRKYYSDDIEEITEKFKIKEKKEKNIEKMKQEIRKKEENIEKMKQEIKELNLENIRDIRTYWFTNTPLFHEFKQDKLNDLFKKLDYLVEILTSQERSILNSSGDFFNKFIEKIQTFRRNKFEKDTPKSPSPSPYSSSSSSSSLKSSSGGQTKNVIRIRRIKKY